MNRRQFLQATGAVSLASSHSLAAGASVALIISPSDKVATERPVQWAANHLEQILKGSGLSVTKHEAVEKAPDSAICIVAAGADAESARPVLTRSKVQVASTPEALAIVQAETAGRRVLLVSGHDARGLTYALLELADAVEHSDSPSAALSGRKSVHEQPANEIRSVTRLFVSDVEDKPWFNDREMWPQYLTMLATHRFNRFNLSLGIGYDFLREVTDAYFLFSYPFLIDVPEYSVRAAGLPDSERDRNLEMLKFISSETVARGMQFQLGLWMHGYEWINSPKPNYTIEGLTAKNHAAYCRDAVALLLKECPNISGITFRVHGESGIDEGSYDFWKTVFDGVVRSGRRVEIDMHSKGMDQSMIDLAVATGLPVKISPKYWAEHMGMPYHQADIRQLEVPQPGREREVSRLMNLSAGSRRFTRYGYGDLMREDRRWGILHRIWPGTQRLLLWGDPVTAAAHSRAFGFCDSDGVEIMEPLSFKGRRGSGIAGDRCGYADASVRPRWDWQKYEYTHRIWGRHLFNPDCEPETWRRSLAVTFGPNAKHAETALAHASRILPIITTAHGASAGNNTYWPEVYTNQPIVDPNQPHPYRDTPEPRTFGNVSALDPQLFLSVNEYTDELLNGQRTGKYSPQEVATWLDEHVATAATHLAALGTGSTPEQRRAVEDLALQVGIGRFFVAKLRAGMLYRVSDRTGDRIALEQALKSYREARNIWSEFATRAKRVYVADITVGERPHLRGHWLDRIAAMDRDIEAMAGKLVAAGDRASSEEAKTVLERLRVLQPRPTGLVHHAPPSTFRPRQPLTIELRPEKAAKLTAVRLCFRHVNHAERYRSVEMDRSEDGYRATVEGQYTDTPYPIAYYFELRESPTNVWLYPGFNADRTNQPYFVVRRARRT
jgi:hypothetical protein